MTRRQSNSQWSGSIAAHPASKNYECKNPLEKFSPRFFGIKTTSSSFIIFQRTKLSTRSISNLCWCNWRTFEGKTPRMTMPRLTGQKQPRRNWPTWASSVLVTLPILRIWPRRITPYFVDWKTIERSPFFFRRGGHFCRRDLVGRTTFWIFFFEWLSEFRATG